MKTLYIFLTITAIEVVVIAFNRMRVKKRRSKLDLFFKRMYANYKGMLVILGLIILFINLLSASIIHILINTIQHIIK